MTIHPACGKIFRDMIQAILVRAEMDESVSDVIATTGQEWDHVRKAIDPAMSSQNVTVQGIMRELLECECGLYREERARGLRS